ncbi:MAG: glycosyltransferase [Prosthecobacter sp.]|uniref:glycosyltransferase n=1 Tax=Prosthecobacter sp. TaxID=1965333 RepID=UPI0025E5F41C|nr:glycosyltransferase [Prosthecobacter sp.]MCF7787324.1 glycosyltransferase [Prosthecobacter sp.]
MSEVSTSHCQRHQFVVFGPDWGRHPSTSQHLFSELLDSNSVVWVETVGLRLPQLNLRDLRRSWQKLLDYFTGRRQGIASEQSGLTVVCPLTLPFTQYRCVRRFNLWQIRRAVAGACQRLGFTQHTLVVTAPSHCDVVGRLGESLSIFYCPDNYALWPGMNPRLVHCMELELTDRVGAIVAVSDCLGERLKASGKPLLVLTQGVNAAHFARSLPPQSSGRFEIVYFGMIDERLDLDLLVELAQRLPQALIRMIGPVLINPTRLREQPNVRLEPQVPFATLPASLSTASLFILPFSLNELSKSCSPLKMKEYLACGRPVVATAVPEAERLAPFVHVASDQASFVTAVAAAVEGRLPFDAEAVKLMIAREGWDAKAQEFIQFVESQRPRH